jgi:probable F420-dependent oxidoreductase
VKFHVVLPGCVHTPPLTQPWEHSLTGPDVVRVAQAADRLGFESLLIPEHFVVSAHHADTTGTHFLDATTAQAVMAGATTRIKLGSMLTLLPLHNPVVMAKAICTLDWLSGGRAAMTVGLGWQEDEYRTLGVPWSGRGSRMDDYLGAMLELWHSDSPRFDGEHTSFADIVFEPKPVQRPHPPLWIGGDVDATLRRAARFGDGWSPWLTPPAEIPEKLDRIRSYPEFDGRPFAVFFSLAALNIGLGGDGHYARDAHAAGSPQEQQRVIDECGQLAKLGVTDTWVAPPPVSGISEYLEHLQWVAECIAPALEGV